MKFKLIHQGRRSGKTHKLVDEAIKLTEQGKKVLIVTRSREITAYLKEIVVNGLNEKNIKYYLANDVFHKGYITEHFENRIQLFGTDEFLAITNITLLEQMAKERNHLFYKEYDEIFFDEFYEATKHKTNKLIQELTFLVPNIKDKVVTVYFTLLNYNNIDSFKRYLKNDFIESYTEVHSTYSDETIETLKECYGNENAYNVEVIGKVI